MPQTNACLDEYEEDIQYDREDKNAVQRLRWSGMLMVMMCHKAIYDLTIYHLIATAKVLLFRHMCNTN